MRTIALCVDSIFDKDRFLAVSRLVKSYREEGNAVLLLPLAMAKRAIRAGNQADFLYFITDKHIDECVALAGEELDVVFLAALRSRMEGMGVTFTLLEAAPLSAPLKEELAEAERWQAESVRLHERFGAQAFSFNEDFLAADHVEQISETITKLLPKDSFVCMRDSFLQDLYAERGAAPAGFEKFYILADSRKQSGLWDNFPLNEFFPDAEEYIEKSPVVTLLPIHCRQAYFGYLIHLSDSVDSACGVLELLSVMLDLTIARYITERKLSFANHELLTANESVARLQETDVLTGLSNSMGFMKDAAKLLSRCRSTGQRIGTVCVDLDRLGNINEIYGHLEGDIAIQMLAQIIMDSIEPHELAARLGSDEFIIVGIQDEESERTEELVEHIKNRLLTYNRISGKEYTLEANISSLVLAPHANMSVENMLDEAFTKKRVLKDSRSSRRTGGSHSGNQRDEREHGVVRGILDENAFLYAFQPIVSARTGEIFAYEALMRTKQEPKLSPLTILKYAGMDERLYDIELSTFSNVLGQVERFRDSLGDRKIFVNSIPGHYLSDDDYNKLHTRYKDIFPNLVVEITEETEFENRTADILRARSNADHFEVAVDDFGTGYSNMSNLLKFLPNYVKIDRTLIENVHEDPRKQHFVKTIIEFAHDNGFLALAEGVETDKELSAVVRMGADLIQGYYTARPEFTLTQTISATIRDEIVKANFVGTHELRKKVYLVNREKELFLMHLAMEHYTGIILSQPELTLHGNPDFTAGLTIKIKEGCSCRLRISNVKLGDVDHHPCIELGRGADLTLIVDGSNEFEGNGIRVPEDATLRIEGSGGLRISPVLSDAYCIGADFNSAFGRIECAMDGTLSLSAEGNHCVGIGGGRCQSGDGIRIVAGRIQIALSGDECVGIGSYSGEVPVSIREANLSIDARVGEGTGIGALHGRQNIEIRDVALEMVGSGSCVAGIGTAAESGGSIRIENASVHMKSNGRRLIMLGCGSGELDISIGSSDVELLSEGNAALGIGSLAEDATLRLINTRLSIVMRVGEPKALGLPDEKMLVVGGTHHLCINEHDSEF